MDTFPPREVAPRPHIARSMVIGGLALVAVFGLLGIVDFATEWLWFDSLHLASVFTTSVGWRLILFVVGAVVFFLIFQINAILARRFAHTYHAPPARAAPTRSWEDLLAQLSSQMTERGEYAPLIRAAATIAGLVLAFLMGLMASGNWMVVLQLLHMTPFGVTDPAFGMDVSFYVFQMPAWRALEGWISTALLLLVLGMAGVYALVLTYELAANWAQAGTWLPRAVKGHLLALAAAILVLIAANHILDLFDLVRSTRGVSYGASYTDLLVQRWVQYLLALSAMGAAALCIISAFANSFRPAITGVAVWGLTLVLGGGIIPAVVQSLDVKPNELERERPYIAYNIQYTRQAFGLDRVEEHAFPAEDAVTRAALDAEPATVENVRLWDPRPLLLTLNQIQAIRQYYQFSSVGVDRYQLEGKYRQVMIAARELNPDRLPIQAQSWVAQQLQYTHGYGVAMSYVNVAGQEGLPQFVVRDVPPTGLISIQHPEIYFGEATKHYIVVHTGTPEFDYPAGDQGAFTTYSGESGISVGSFFSRLLFALKFGDPNLLLNSSITSDSLLIYRRHISERVRAVAPFLRLDPDPYMVVADGSLYWIQDAYTTTDRYPYSQPYRPTDRTQRPFNYIRNSVKIVTNARDGSVHFYVAEPSDPLIQTLDGIFPDLFSSTDQAPASIRQHFRYPEQLFQVQAETYRLYHMTDPRVFYLREDVWAIPDELFTGQRQPLAPYWVIMNLPGEPQPEFALILPFVPGTRDNMIGWMAARNDQPNYGRLVVYNFPKDKLIFGPLQIETRIDQDPTISAQFSLWNQTGSRVIRGDLLVIPIGQSNLYVEPIYLQSTESPLPELKRVILATGSKIVMQPSLAESLADLFGTQPPGAAAPSPSPTPTATAPSGGVQTVQALVAQAQAAYNRAQDALRAGDFAGYGDALRQLQDVLNALSQATSGG
ncbi:MAG TPA: UPF0182 family protein [Chloroflexota bacterium]